MGLGEMVESIPTNVSGSTGAGETLIASQLYYA